MARSNTETAKLISDGFNSSSKDWEIDRYQYSNQGEPSPGTRHVQAVIARLSSAVGGDDEVLHAIAGVKTNSDGGHGEEFEVAVFTKAALFHSRFGLDDKKVEVEVIPRATITALRVTDSGPYTQEENPARLKFTAVYDNGLSVSFPLKNNTWSEMDWLSDVYSGLKSDLLTN
ncbi:hypothetical protein [Arthrobacter sp. 92]|uniref:hypothetical protein n=1 Tax=Arthrobacter sp. 92 TaxID=3418175 RepID=UPI003D0329D9